MTRGTIEDLARLEALATEHGLEVHHGEFQGMNLTFIQLSEVRYIQVADMFNFIGDLRVMDLTNPIETSTYVNWSAIVRERGVGKTISIWKAECLIRKAYRAAGVEE